MSFHNKSVYKGKQIPRKTWQTIRQYTANHTVKSLLSLTNKIDNKKGLPLFIYDNPLLTVIISQFHKTSIRTVDRPRCHHSVAAGTEKLQVPEPRERHLQLAVPEPAGQTVRLERHSERHSGRFVPPSMPVCY